MSSACTCHIDKNTCFWCKVSVGTFATETSQGTQMILPNGKTLVFHTLDMNDAHELADALSEFVMNFEME